MGTADPMSLRGPRYIRFDLLPEDDFAVDFAECVCGRDSETDPPSTFFAECHGKAGSASFHVGAYVCVYCIEREGEG